MISRGEVVLDRHDPTYILEVLRRKATYIDGHEFDGWAVVEHPFVYEDLGYFRGGNLSYGYGLRQLREAIENN